jgi:hypothetical protein
VYDIDNIKSTLQNQSGSVSGSGLGSDLLFQQLGDIKRNISSTVIAGTGIKIEKSLYALPITTPATFCLYSVIYAKGMFVIVGMVE